MPDWKEATAYEFTKKLDRQGWAWEFLRRNPKYAEDYLAAREAADTLGPKGPPHLRRRAARDLLIRAGKKWRLEREIRDPTRDEPPEFASGPYPQFPRWHELPAFFTGSTTHPVDDNYQLLPGVCIVVFDISRPIKKQLAEARKVLMRQQGGTKLKFGKQTKPERWRLYLRLLDAKKAGASNKVIYRHLADDYKYFKPQDEGENPAMDAISDDSKVARELRDEPWAFLY